MKKYILFLFSSFMLFNVVHASQLTNYAKSAILVEPTTKKVIYKLNENERLAPASMTKIMTLLLIMEAIDNGNISLNDEVLISSNAANMGGSQVFLEANSKIKVEELIKSIAIASGNDAAVAMAEYIGGSTQEFVNMMNNKVKELGLKNTNFVNVHGLDEDNHYSSAYDMAMIALELLKYPNILKYTSLYEDYLVKPDGSKTWLVNTNKLVRFYDGVDGLKTGYTGKAGYCLTSTAKKNNIRFLTVVMGEDTSEHRSLDTTNMLNYAFANYKVNNIINKDDVITNVKVLRGVKDNINVYVKEEVNDVIKHNEEKEYSYQKEINTLKAPLKSGDVVGKLKVIDNNNILVKEVDLVVKEDINKNNFFTLFYDFFRSIVVGI